MKKTQTSPFVVQVCSWAQRRDASFSRTQEGCAGRRPGCPWWGVGTGRGSPEQSHGSRRFKPAPRLACAVQGGGSPGRGCGPCSRVPGFPTVPRGCPQGAGVAGQEGAGRDDPHLPLLHPGSPPDSPTNNRGGEHTPSPQLCNQHSWDKTNTLHRKGRTF